jgi:hypothetical protein
MGGVESGAEPAAQMLQPCLPRVEGLAQSVLIDVRHGGSTLETVDIDAFISSEESTIHRRMSRP